MLNPLALQDFEKNSPDLATGVTAVLITKTPDPAWKPPLAEISTVSEKTIRETYFPSAQEAAKREGRYKELDYLRDRTYWEYPHRFVCALPRERDVRAVVGGYFKGAPDNGFTKQEVVDW